MKLKAIALDYDGTIAEHGHLVPAVRHSIVRARERGLAVIIVTGRIHRHRTKYLDVPVAPQHAFVFSQKSGEIGGRGQAPCATSSSCWSDAPHPVVMHTCGAVTSLAG
ncbi:HAD hydrolase family protein [Ramlibacter sp. AN1015]|uniref:HAD family hydrolase n=1 Tax=Ramlibacter sp. AN1015 TaxID=3133428 RepID=UPI0030BA4726